MSNCCILLTSPKPCIAPHFSLGTDCSGLLSTFICLYYTKEREATLDKIRLALVGCGGMGTRHLYGLGTSPKPPFDNVELVAVCDIRRDNAELAAVEAEKLVGQRPAVFTDLETMHREVPDLMAVDVVVEPIGTSRRGLPSTRSGATRDGGKAHGHYRQGLPTDDRGRRAQPAHPVGGGKLPPRSLVAAGASPAGTRGHWPPLHGDFPLASPASRGVHHALAAHEGSGAGCFWI